eukprot:MONOS_12808.1-p1 / transcript=MONOS_12808.1 / gene=MONOS_12808 / organism=Monocercomonoides_exilis_PA203 / gene_product=unspecified product / transcript_product=unspecified product / location=Mono_scaffold00735:26513-29575(-) / protein_length=711 / sequence_SO=supercontig / SO=protein_coding / is_pseudo=false
MSSESLIMASRACFFILKSCGLRSITLDPCTKVLLNQIKKVDVSTSEVESIAESIFSLKCIAEGAKVRTFFVEYGVIPVAVSLVHSQHVQIRKQALLLLSTLTLSSKQTLNDLVAKHNILKPLIKILTSTARKYMQKEKKKSLNEDKYHKANKSRMVTLKTGYIENSDTVKEEGTKKENERKSKEEEEEDNNDDNDDNNDNNDELDQLIEPALSLCQSMAIETGVSSSSLALNAQLRHSFIILATTSSVPVRVRVSSCGVLCGIVGSVSDEDVTDLCSDILDTHVSDIINNIICSSSSHRLVRMFIQIISSLLRSHTRTVLTRCASQNVSPIQSELPTEDGASSSSSSLSSTVDDGLATSSSQPKQTFPSLYSRLLKYINQLEGNGFFDLLPLVLNWDDPPIRRESRDLRKLNYQISSPLWYGLFVALVITLGALMKSYNNKKRCFPCLGQEAFSFLVSIFFGIVTAILQVVFVILDLFHIFDSVKPTGVIVFESWIGLVQKGVGIICVLFALLYYGLGVRKFKNSVMNVHMRKTLTTQTVIMMVAIVIVALASLCNTLFLTLVSERIADRDVELHPEYGNNQDVDELPGLNTIHVSATLADDLPSFIIMLCLFFFTIHTVLHFVIIPVISSLRYPVTLLKDEPSQPSSGASSKENAQERTSSSSSSSSSHTNTSETAAAAASASGMPRSVLVEMKPLDSADTSSVNNAV